MTKIIREKHVETVGNLEPKPWSQVSGPWFRFLVLDLKS